MKKMLLFLLLLVSLTAFSQNDSIQKKLLNGQIIHAETKKALSAAHILNLNTVEGTITDENGFFELPTRVNDTILVSYLGFHPSN
jgi:hypothetical protein